MRATTTSCQGRSGRAEAARDAAHELPSDGPVAVEGRIEDRHLEPDDTAAPDRACQDDFELIPTQSAGQPVIHRRHDGVVEDIAVQVDPEATELGAHEPIERVYSGSLHTAGPYGVEIDHRQSGVLDALATCS